MKVKYEALTDSHLFVVIRLDLDRGDRLGLSGSVCHCEAGVL